MVRIETTMAFPMKSANSSGNANRLIISLLAAISILVVSLSIYTASLTKRLEALSEELDRLDTKYRITNNLDIQSGDWSEHFLDSKSEDLDTEEIENFNIAEENVDIFREDLGFSDNKISRFDSQADSDKLLRRARRQISNNIDVTELLSTDPSEERVDAWTRDPGRTYEVAMAVVGGASRSKNKVTSVSPAENKKDKREQQDKRSKQLSLPVAHFHAVRGEAKTFTSPSKSPVNYPFWTTDNTVSQNSTFFHLVSEGSDKGKVLIRQTGIYMIYAQMLYHDLSGRWSFGIFVGDTERFKCMNSEQIHEELHKSESSQRGSHSVYQHCYTSGVVHISKMTQVSVRCLYGQRTVVLQPEFTFWGIVKLS